MILNFLMVIMSMFFSTLHPFHVSVCDIEFNENSKSLQVSQRVFLDDLEKVLNEKYNIKLVLDEEPNNNFIDSLIQVYIFENLRIDIDGKEKKSVYIGSEIEEDGIWCYIEYKGVKKLESLQVTSTIFLETFDDQSNIIHFRSGDYEKSTKLDRMNKVSTFTPN